MSRRTVSRRRLVGSAGAMAALGALSRGPFVISAETLKNKLGVAVIGVGGMGGGNPGTAADERFVAMCDIDDKAIAKAAEKIKGKVPNPKVYIDYRKMLEECHKEIDVVLIATPDHHHGPAAIRAINLGKHAFVQKPLAHNIYECRTLAEAAKKNKVHTQMGNQGHCGEGYRRLCEYIWAGAIGNVIETHSILGRNFGGKSQRPGGKPIPEGVHWDEWLGPAPQRDYHDGLHPFGWRSWRDFGTGTIGDMSCHVLDGIFWALRIGECKGYQVTSLAQTDGSAEQFTQNNILRWDIPARGDMPAVKCYAYDNEKQKPQVMKDLEQKYQREFKNGTIYVGEKGYMYTGTYGDGVRIVPEEAHKAFPIPEMKIPRAKGGPIGDLFRAIRGEVPAACSNFVDYSGPFTEFVLTGLLAQNAGVNKTLKWDVAAMKSDNEQANQGIKRTYRGGWEV